MNIKCQSKIQKQHWYQNQGSSNWTKIVQIVQKKLNKDKIASETARGEHEDDWDGYELMMVHCDTKDCDVWVAMRKGWKRIDNGLKCGVCINVMLEKMAEENKQLREELAECKRG